MENTDMYEGKHLRIFENRNGYETVERVGKLKGYPDAVVIRARHENKILVLEHWRETHQKWFLEFPAGLIDDDESYLDTAIRELREETGVDLKNKSFTYWTSPVLPTSTGLTNEEIVFVDIKLNEEIPIDKNFISTENIRNIMWIDKDNWNYTFSIDTGIGNRLYTFLEKESQKQYAPYTSEAKENLDYICEGIQNFLAKNTSLKGFVLGLSGGIDSAISAAIIRYMKIKNMLPEDFKLHGISFPILSNKEDETIRAEACEGYCDDFIEYDYSEYDLKQIINFFYDTGSNLKYLQNNYNQRMNKGNIKARMRMIKFYDIARKTNSCVLSTGNLSETLLGFWTLHGDVGDFGFISHLWKTEIYEMAHYLVNWFRKNGYPDLVAPLKACIEAIPTDGLGISNNDFEQIGLNSYQDIDKVLKICYESEFVLLGKKTPIETGYGEVFQKLQSTQRSNNEEFIDCFSKIIADYLNFNWDAVHKVVKLYANNYFKRFLPVTIPRK